MPCGLLAIDMDIAAGIIEGNELNGAGGGTGCMPFELNESKLVNKLFKLRLLLLLFGGLLLLLLLKSFVIRVPNESIELSGGVLDPCPA